MSKYRRLKGVNSKVSKVQRFDIQVLKIQVHNFVYMQIRELDRLKELKFVATVSSTIKIQKLVQFRVRMKFRTVFALNLILYQIRVPISFLETFQSVHGYRTSENARTPMRNFRRSF